MTDDVLLKALGQKSEIPEKPDIKILEVFDSPSKQPFYVTFTQEREFTSKCPVTGQPDFASIKILYLPNEKCVESKSLKLYLASYRNEGSFGEAITNKIADDLNLALEPRFLVVVGDFAPRGGIGWSTEAVRIGCMYFKGAYPSTDYMLTDMDKLQIAKFNVRTVREF